MNKLATTSALVVAMSALMSGCNEHAQYDASHQAGANPPMPEARNFFAPPMQVPKYVGWQNGATPKGQKVTVKAELLEVEGRKLRFKVEAHDEERKVGEGTHRRAIIQVQKKD